MKSLSGYQVQLTPIEQQDLEMLRTWRNDPNVSQFMLSQEEITPEQQQIWFKKVQRDPNQQHFIIWYKEQPIGAANIRSKDSSQSIELSDIIEAGIYIADHHYRNNILAFAPTLVLNDYCFNQLGVSKLVAVVKADNLAALNYNAKLGYRVDNKDQLMEISLTAEDYEKHTAVLKGLLSRTCRKTE